MREILKNFSTSTLITAIEANTIEQFLSTFAPFPQIKIHKNPDIVWIATNIPHPYLNCVLRACLVSNKIDAKIEKVLTYFRSHLLPMTWCIGPSSQPVDLGNYLIAHGLTHAKDETGMAVDLLTLKNDLPPPIDLKIKWVNDAETLREWIYPVTISFNYPDSVANILLDFYARQGFGQELPWQYYVGYINGKAVAASRLFLSCGVAGIYHVATVPQLRRQGIGLAMTLAPLNKARLMGYRIGVLRSSELGSGVYRRLGFKEYCQFNFYIWTS